MGAISCPHQIEASLNITSFCVQTPPSGKSQNVRSSLGSGDSIERIDIHVETGRLESYDGFASRTSNA